MLPAFSFTSTAKVAQRGRQPKKSLPCRPKHGRADQNAGTSTVAILAQGTHWAVATSQAFFRRAHIHAKGTSISTPPCESTIAIAFVPLATYWSVAMRKPLSHLMAASLTNRPASVINRKMPEKIRESDIEVVRRASATIKTRQEKI